MPGHVTLAQLQVKLLDRDFDLLGLVPDPSACRRRSTHQLSQDEITLGRAAAIEELVTFVERSGLNFHRPDLMIECRQIIERPDANSAPRKNRPSLHLSSRSTLSRGSEVPSDQTFTTHREPDHRFEVPLLCGPVLTARVNERRNATGAAMSRSSHMQRRPTDGRARPVRTGQGYSGCRRRHARV